MLRAAGNVQKNNTKMLIRVMCNMGPHAVTLLLVIVFVRPFVAKAKLAIFPVDEY